MAPRNPTLECMQSGRSALGVWANGPGKFLVSVSGGIGTSQKGSLRLLGILIAFRSRLSATTQLPPKVRHNSRTALNASEQWAPAPAALID
jgi:hypothetical protein